jgi:hypothetical protein
MTVVVTVYDTEYGKDVKVFPTVKKAMQHRDKVADQYWEREFDTPKPRSMIGQLYFRAMETRETDGYQETFEVFVCDYPPTE